MTRLQTRLATLAVALLSLMLALVVGEVALRIADYSYSPMAIELKLHADQRSYHAFRQDEFEYDSALIWAPRPGRSVFNAQGFRGPVLQKQKPAGEFRIFAVGDSNTLGWAEKSGANWPASLGRILAKRHPECAVVNAGVWGYSSYQGLARLRQVLRFQPDLVLFSFGANDAHPVTVPDSHYVATPEALEALEGGTSRLSRLRLVQLFVAVRDRLAASGRAQAPVLTHRVPLEDYRANLEQAIALAHGHGVKIVLLTRPYVGESHDPHWWKRFGRDYNEATVEIGRRHHVPVVDLYSAFKDLDSDFVDESHFTARGHHDAAAIIAASLIPLLD